jgi:hypothetical protein
VLIPDFVVCGCISENGCNNRHGMCKNYVADCDYQNIKIKVTDFELLFYGF